VAVSLPGARQLKGFLSGWGFLAGWSGLTRFPGFLSGWRGLARFWAALLTLSALTAGVLQLIGPAAPPEPEPVALNLPTGPASTPPKHAASSRPAGAPAAAPANASRDAARTLRPGRDTPGPTADPDPALLEPVASDPKLLLPRISIDHRAPMSAYAAGFDSSTLRPRVGILVAGIGPAEADSLAAIKTLPGGITLAISPYISDISRLLVVARLNEHEYLLSLPMEPQGFPVNDPDDRVALMTSLPPVDNINRLHAILGRVTGYAGVTDALGAMHGDRLVAQTEQFEPLLEEIGARGLLFIDARTAQKRLPYAWNRSADMILDDEPLNAASLDQRLDELTHMALDKGSALGVVSQPRPVTVERLAAWANSLASKGLALAPVSALVLPPEKQDQEK
jgi:polysaccharide deacetylase 2 family uncharacterized protein YibQ